MGIHLFDFLVCDLCCGLNLILKEELGAGFKDGVFFIPMKVVHVVHAQKNI